SFQTTFDPSKDIHISYDIEIGSKDISKNLSLLGSGTLQIIEILLALYESKKDLNIILLDEPDSHIHRDIQKRLMKVLEQSSQNTQIFISTHNESLIRSSKPTQIFHLEKTNQSKTYKPIFYDKQQYISQGLIPSKHLKVLQDLGNESALDFINALEADRLVFVEGKYDPKYIQFILDKYTDIGESPRIAYWSFEGIDNILKHIFSYKEVFSKIKNQKSLWEKSILIFDRDYLSDKQATQLQTQLENKLKIPVHIWNFYTIESVYLSDLNTFSKLIAEVLPKDVSKQEIMEALQIEIAQIAQEKLEQLDQTLKGKILKWLKDKEELFQKSGLGNNILSSREAYSNIREYHKDKLEQNEIDSLATKEDIESIIINIMKKYESECENSNCFELLLSTISKHTLWFEEWDKMIGKIK
ncbi:MAG: AAA family ATPase, partial [Campylobacterota bacterium]|nr:AAA family ATPase [Campylobacterota bacterium]